MPTVHALRNEIRVAIGRYERQVSSDFTKEALEAICGAVGSEIETGTRPSKPEMRSRIISAVTGEDADPAEYDRSFRKAELEAIADALRED